MAMKSRASTAFVMFDVVYTDGTLRSNRKVPASVLGGLDGDEPARGVIEAQDRETALASGRAAGDVRSIVRSPPRAAAGDSGTERKAKGGKK